ncbi:unnamed protein product [Periconia digitata]|uniref:NADAR domain-containing protein n=1 Tax=Periconia digitata TaxID=1303443 RepID=A0A9W4XGP8_9PLEO|nr:unnamed protein product [Periconia digitata]
MARRNPKAAKSPEKPGKDNAKRPPSPSTSNQPTSRKKPCTKKNTDRVELSQPSDEVKTKNTSDSKSNAPATSSACPLARFPGLEDWEESGDSKKVLSSPSTGTQNAADELIKDEKMTDVTPTEQLDATAGSTDDTTDNMESMGQEKAIFQEAAGSTKQEQEMDGIKRELPLRLDRREWDERAILFFGNQGEWGWMSNSYPSTFRIHGLTYLSMEQYYQYEKARLFRDYDAMKAIFESASPSNAKRWGKKVKNFDKVRWNRVFPTCMQCGLLAKFKLGENAKELQEKLVATGKAPIYSCNPSDKRWSVGLSVAQGKRFLENRSKAAGSSHWPGRNYLGKYLMLVRKDLVEEAREKGNAGLLEIFENAKLGRGAPPNIMKRDNKWDDTGDEEMLDRNADNENEKMDLDGDEYRYKETKEGIKAEDVDDGVKVKAEENDEVKIKAEEDEH